MESPPPAEKCTLKMKQCIRQAEALAADIETLTSELEHILQEVNAGELQRLRSEIDARICERESLGQQLEQLEEEIRSTKRSLEKQVASVDDTIAESVQRFAAVCGIDPAEAMEMLAIAYRAGAGSGSNEESVATAFAVEERSFGSSPNQSGQQNYPGAF